MAEKLRQADEAIARIDAFSGRMLRPEVLHFILNDAALAAHAIQLVGFKQVLEAMRSTGLLESTEEGQAVLAMAGPLAAVVDMADAVLSARFGYERGASA